LDGHSIHNVTNGKSDAHFITVEANFMAAVNGFTAKNMPFMTDAMKMRYYNKVLEEDAKRDTPVLAAETPYAISASYHGKQALQLLTPAPTPAPTPKPTAATADSCEDLRMRGITASGVCPINTANSITNTKCLYQNGRMWTLLTYKIGLATAP
jgi:hypothetical protein